MYGSYPGSYNNIADGEILCRSSRGITSGVCVVFVSATGYMSPDAEKRSLINPGIGFVEFLA